MLEASAGRGAPWGAAPVVSGVGSGCSAEAPIAAGQGHFSLGLVSAPGEPLLWQAAGSPERQRSAVASASGAAPDPLQCAPGRALPSASQDGAQWALAHRYTAAVDQVSPVGSAGPRGVASGRVSPGAPAAAEPQPCHLLNLHVLGLSGLPGAAWLERLPSYELVVHVGKVVKRVKLRMPPPPLGVPGVGDSSEVDIKGLVPDDSSLQRLNEFVSMRLGEAPTFLQADVWEERASVLALGRGGPSRKLLGQAYIPLEPKFSRRPCTWPIASQGASTDDLGYLTCKFALAGTPGPVRGLRVGDGGAGANDVSLAWEPPRSDGGAALRGYRVEARAVSGAAASSAAVFMGEAPRTASAAPTAAPSAVVRGLMGNSSYAFRVWAISEAGPGPRAELLAATGAVAPGLCGLPRSAPAGPPSGFSDAPLWVEWAPPDDTGGATVVAYRVWLRPLFSDSLGNVYPSDGWIDLGLFEHRGGALEVQHAPVRLDALPACSGCLCSVAALNSAGHTGPSTPEVPVFLEAPAPRERVDIWELGSHGDESGESPYPSGSAEVATGAAAEPVVARQGSSPTTQFPARRLEAELQAAGSPGSDLYAEALRALQGSDRGFARTAGEFAAEGELEVLVQPDSEVVVLPDFEAHGAHPSIHWQGAAEAPAWGLGSRGALVAGHHASGSSPAGSLPGAARGGLCGGQR